MPGVFRWETPPACSSSASSTAVRQEPSAGVAQLGDWGKPVQAVTRAAALSSRCGPGTALSAGHRCCPGTFDNLSRLSSLCCGSRAADAAPGHAAGSGNQTCAPQKPVLAPRSRCQCQHTRHVTAWFVHRDIPVAASVLYLHPPHSSATHLTYVASRVTCVPRLLVGRLTVTRMEWLPCQVGCDRTGLRTQDLCQLGLGSLITTSLLL